MGDGIRGRQQRFPVSNRATIAVLPAPAEAGVGLRVTGLGTLITTVVLLPLSQAVWMLAT